MKHATLENRPNEVWPPQKDVSGRTVCSASKTTRVPAPQADFVEARWIRDVLRARSRRAKFFSSHLFADPAWDMLLALYAAELAQSKLAVTNLASASGIPATTALRWMNALLKEGLLCREDDPRDRRRSFVRLSPKGWQSIREYFESLPAWAYPL